MRPTIAECAGCKHSNKGYVDWQSACMNCSSDMLHPGRPSNYEESHISVTSSAESLPADQCLASDSVHTPARSRTYSHKRLKPCPFCGGKAKLSRWEAIHEYSVFCTKCNAVAGDYEDTEEKAIERWNKRFV